ncbi:MAG: response regulator [Planctomycetaceae bacterium]|nr:response regulator [Planctomycetaceae bacterium]
MTSSLNRSTHQGGIDADAVTDARRLMEERYEMGEVLHLSAQSVRFLGRDRETSKQLVIRMTLIECLPAGVLMRLEYEAAIRRTLQSEWLPEVFFTGRVGHWHVFVREFVPGVSLHERMLRGPHDVRESLNLGAGMFAGLRDLHQSGVLHHRVHPSNIIVNDEGPLSQICLVDFGTQSPMFDDTALAESEMSAEALRYAWYLAPEQSGLIDQEITEPSDLYAAGAVLFHCLSGQPPFTSQTLGTLLLDHMTSPVPRLQDDSIGPARALNELLQRTLRKDPRDRYQSAEAVLADVKQLIAANDAGVVDPHLVIGAQDRRNSLTEPAFVSRIQEMKRLGRHLESAIDGRGGILFLEGESGAGKTRLLQECARSGAQQRFHIFQGRGTNDVALEPFRVLQGVVEGILLIASSDIAWARIFREQLAEDVNIICKALPDLSSLLKCDTSIIPRPETFAEARTIEALARLLECLGTKNSPALVILDDCQWADEQTNRLIRKLHERRENADSSCYMQLIVAFRSEEVPGDHPLRQIGCHDQICLSGLHDDEVRNLAESMAGPLPEDAVEVVTRLASGSPFMASAVLRGLVETGALVHTPEGWRVESLAMDSIHSSNQAGALLAKRLELLPDDARRLLSWGAVLGSEFEIEMVTRLSGMSAPRAIQAIDDARDRRLIWCRQNGRECSFVHDKIREALLESQERTEREERHVQAAFDLQRYAPDRHSAIAFHFDAAGKPLAALKDALKAGEEASEQHALEIAEQQFRIARRASEDTDRRTRFRIESGLGHVLMVRGRYTEAAEAFEAAARFAVGTVGKAELKGKLAELAIKRGDMDQAVRDYEAALRLLGVRVPQSQFMLLVLFLIEAWIQVLHTIFPSAFLNRHGRAPVDQERLQMKLLSGLSHGCWYCRSKLSVYWSHFRGMNLGERFAPSLELAQIYADHAPAMTIIPVPLFRRGISYAKKSLAIRREFGDLWGQGQSLHYYGIVHYAASQYTECIARCRESIRILERLGDYWQVHIARYQIAASYYRLGDMQAAITEARLNHQSGIELGDEQASGIILDVWSWSTEGRVPLKLLRTESQRIRHDAQGKAQVLGAQAHHFLCANDPRRALRIFEQAIRVCWDAGVQNVYTQPLYSWRATALRQWAQQSNTITPVFHGALLRRAHDAALDALRRARFYQNEKPHALRELGLILAMQGQMRRAFSCLDKSLIVARTLGARYEYAKTAIVRARLCRELGDANANEQLQEAERLLAELALPVRKAHKEREDTASPSLSLVDRFGTLLDSGRKIASALSAPVIFQETRTAALQLLRGESCSLLNVVQSKDGISYKPMEVHSTQSYHQPLLDQAVERRAAVSSGKDSNRRSLVQAEEIDQRSVLCAPILVRGRVVACLYISHANVRGLFGATEESLADFITTIAGAALENAEGFSELQQLNATLEQRVEERTKAVELRAQELSAANSKLEHTAHRLRQARSELITSKRQVEIASEAKSRFLAAMSHEVRTPMNGIIGMAELALRTPLSDQQRKYLTILNDSAGSLLDLLNDVLDFSKIEAGKLTLENVPLDLHELLAGCTRMFAGRAAEKCLDLICHIDSNVPQTVVGDPCRLRQILMNLLGNAIKFTDAGEIVLRVQLNKDDANDEHSLHFQVQDTGLGISPDNQKLIFNAFDQGNSSVARQHGGTGLGLSISSELVDLMGGNIWVESEEGVGTCFHVVLPLVIPLTIVRGASVSTNPVPSRAIANQRVLVVSPSAAGRDAYAESLTSCDCELVSVSNKDETQLAILESQQNGRSFSLVVVDADDSVQANLELLRSLRQLIANEGCRIAILTPVDMMEHSDILREWGADHVLMKPVMPDDLRRCARNEIDTRLQSQLIETPASNQPRHNSLPSPVVEMTSQSLRVLVADDSPVNQDVATGLLEYMGHKVEVADNGRAAVDAVETGTFDVVLMDIEMPVMDGLEATRKIREQEAAGESHLPVIAMSAHSIDGIEESGRAAGMDHFVSKPINPAEIKRVLENLDQIVSANTISIQK